MTSPKTRPHLEFLRSDVLYSRLGELMKFEHGIAEKKLIFAVIEAEAHFV